MHDLNRYAARSGRVIKEDGSVVNEADGINPDGSRAVVLKGSNVQDYGLITPNDSTDLPKVAIGFIVTGVAGTLAVNKPDGTAVTIPASMITVGSIVPLPVKRIKATGTTATDIWAVYGS